MVSGERSFSTACDGANTNQLDDESDQIGNPCDRCPQTLGSVEYDGCPEATPDAGAGGADAQAPATPDAGDDRPAPPEEEDEESPAVNPDDPAVGKMNCSCRMPGAPSGAGSALGGSFSALVALGLVVLRKARRV